MTKTLQKYVYYGQKSFITLVPGCVFTNLLRKNFFSYYFEDEIFRKFGFAKYYRIILNEILVKFIFHNFLKFCEYTPQLVCIKLACFENETF